MTASSISKVDSKSRSETKIKLAEKAGVSMSVLNSITQGKNIATDSAKRVSDALGQPMAALFEPVENDKPLSSKTILHHHRLISVILAMIFSNPCDRVRPPLEAKEAHYLDEKQAAQLLSALERESAQNQTIVKLLLYTGMRRGELCGLMWEDIDFQNAVIHIRRSSLYLAEKGIFEDETKNQTSKRSIKVPDDAIRTLRGFRAWQHANVTTTGKIYAHAIQSADAAAADTLQDLLNPLAQKK